jgi:hypothetical protein
MPVLPFKILKIVHYTECVLCLCLEKAGRFKKHQHPPFFSKMRTLFKNRPPWYHGEANSPWYHGGGFLKNGLRVEEKGGG